MSVTFYGGISTENFENFNKDGRKMACISRIWAPRLRFLYFQIVFRHILQIKKVPFQNNAFIRQYTHFRQHNKHAPYGRLMQTFTDLLVHRKADISRIREIPCLWSVLKVPQQCYITVLHSVFGIFISVTVSTTYPENFKSISYVRNFLWRNKYRKL